MGDTVNLINHGVEATVLKAPKDGKVYVQAGAVKLSVALSEIEPTKAQKTPAVRVGGFKRENVQASMEIDVRGMTLDEAIMETDTYLDQAFLSGKAEVAIIHGKGTGVLRAGIRDYLRTNVHASKFREGKYGEGDAGVTVVTIK